MMAHKCSCSIAVAGWQVHLISSCIDPGNEDEEEEEEKAPLSKCSCGMSPVNILSKKRLLA